MAAGFHAIMKAENQGWMPYALPYEEMLAEIMVNRASVFEFAGTADQIHRIDASLIDDPDSHIAKKAGLYQRLQGLGHDVELSTEACGHCFHENGRRRSYKFLSDRLKKAEDRL